MTEREAYQAIRRPLVFGDERQIQAVRLLDSIATCVEQLKENPECENCDGIGNYFQPCSECSGQGCDECTDGEILEDCPICNGLGIFVLDWPDFPIEIIEQAKIRISKGAALR